MGIQAQAALKEKKITVIADKSYYSGVDIKNSQDEGMAVMVPKSDTSASDKNEFPCVCLQPHKNDKDQR